MGQRENGFYVLSIAGQAGGFLANPSIARNAEHFGDARRPAQLPHQSVLPSSVADYQYSHGLFTRPLRINQRGPHTRDVNTRTKRAAPDTASALLSTQPTQSLCPPSPLCP